MKSFTHKKENIASIFGKQISIPQYQRSYDWETEMISNLLDDLLNTFEELDHAIGTDTTIIEHEKYKEWFQNKVGVRADGDLFYLGQIVKFENDIVDGQQRLTSLVIIFRALLDLFEINSGEKYADFMQLLTNYGQPRLHSAESDKFFSNIIQTQKFILAKSWKLKQTDGITSENWSKFKRSTFGKNYFKSYEVIKNRELFKRANKPQQLNFLKNFIYFILNYVWVLTIEVDSVIDAIEFFEVMNSKSQALAPGDLIKNNLIKSNLKGSTESTAKAWNDIETEILKTDIEISKFIRYVYICRHGNVSSKGLFQKVTKLKGVSIVDEMNDYLDAFRKVFGLEETGSVLIDAQLNFIYSIGARESLTPIILEIFRTCKEDSDKIQEMLDFLVSFAYRFFFKKGFKANLYAKDVYDICVLISKKSNDPFLKLKDAYFGELDSEEKDAYDDEMLTFKADQSKDSIKFAKALYPLIIAKLNGSENEGEEFEIGKMYLKDWDVEHLYPQNPDKTKKVWEDLQNPNNLWNIGNLIPILNSKNRTAKNASFKAKFELYTGVTPIGQYKSDDKKLMPSPLFKKLFINLLPNVTANDKWLDASIIEREKKILELIKRLDVLSIDKW